MDLAALVISLVALGWTIYSFLRSPRPAIRIGAVFAETPKDLHALVAYLSNAGTVETTIPYAALEVKGSQGGIDLAQRYLDLPLLLVPGRYEPKVIPGGPVIDALVELKADGPWTYRLILIDHAGREHRSNWVHREKSSEPQAATAVPV